MIDEERIKKTLEDLSFPRLSGTEHEKKASNVIRTKIEELGVTPELQEFSFTTFYPKIYKRLAFCSISWLLLVLFIYINILFVILNILLLSFLFIPIIILVRQPEDVKIGKRYDSDNIYIRIKSRNQEIENNKYQFLLICHKDSKSQRLTITFRSINTRVWVYSFSIILFTLVLKYFFLSNIIFNIIIATIIGVNWISTFLIIFNSTGNKSPGAIDNGSGISIVLELLNHFNQRENRLKNIDLWFLFTGCEENGTMGIRNLYREHKREWIHERVRYLNFDSIGTNLDIFAVKNKLEHTFLFKLLLDLSKELNPTYHIKYYILAVNRSDGYYLKNKNYKGIGFADKKAYKFIHSPNDTVDKVDPKFLADVGRIIVKLLEEYDEKLYKNHP